MKKILSIDGGGIRGIIPGQILVALEEKLKVQTGDQDTRIADHFDFFAGTSTGGILTCLLLCPSPDDPKKAKFTAQEAVNLYLEHGAKIFNKNTLQSVLNPMGLLDEIYNASPLEKLLKEYFGDLRLSQLIKPCIIPAYDIDNRISHFFAQHDYAVCGPGKDFLVRDVCRATSAAPSYFETALVKSISGVSYPLIDGGVFANNPTLCAYSEIRNAIDTPTAADMYILSIGTGSQHLPYKYDKAKNWGKIGWIQPVIDIMMAGASETTNYHLEKMYSAVQKEGNYNRIQPARMGNASLEMDNASQNNLQALSEVGIKTSEDCSVKLDEIVKVLMEEPDPVKFKLEYEIY